MLANIWLEVARQQRISNPDRLPCSLALEQIRVSFTARFGIYLSSDDVFWVFPELRPILDGAFEIFGDKSEYVVATPQYRAAANTAMG